MGYDRNDCWMTCGERDDKCAERGLGTHGDPWAEIERLRTAFLGHLQNENRCLAVGKPCQGPALCGCLLEMETAVEAAGHQQQPAGTKP